MGARRVVVRGVLRQQRPQVPFVDDYQMVETLASQRPDEALGDRVSRGSSQFARTCPAVCIPAPPPDQGASSGKA